MVVIELVAADREIRDSGLRQAATVSLFRRRAGVAVLSDSPTNRESTTRDV
jgi:hypothetical protein